MGIARTTTVLTAIIALLAACGEETGSSEAGGDPTAASSTGSAADTPTSEWTGKTIPDGTYAKTDTMADARRLGLPRDVASEILGRDGAFRVELKIAGDNWVQFSEEAGAMVVGDEGTATYDGDGNWVTTSDSFGCPGCVTTVAWTFKGQRLTTKIVDGQGTGDPVDALIGRLVMEGEWTRQ